MRELEHLLESRLLSQLLPAAFRFETTNPILYFDGHVLRPPFWKRRRWIILDAELQRLGDLLAGDQRRQKQTASMLAETPAPVTYLPSR